MDTVPNEVLVFIFSQLATKDLLKFRLVNQIWKENASHMCRRKGVTLRLKRADLNKTVTENLQVIFETFRDLVNLPWSNCCLGSWRHTRNRNSESLNPEHIKKFVGIFGPYLKGIKFFGDDFKIFMQILPGLQNLEVLKCRVETVTDKIHEIQSLIELKPLKRLKFFQSRVTASSDVQFIKAIIDKIPNPTQIDEFFLNITTEPNSWENADQCKQLASILANISSTIILTIQFRNCLTGRSFLLRSLALKKLNIHDLAIFVEDLEANDSEYFTPLEEFLASIAPGLAELDIVDKRQYESTEFPTFTIPVLPALRELNLQGDDFDVGPTFPYLSRFRADQFPKLKKVRILNVNGHGFQVFDSCSLSSVSVLEFFDEEEEEEITVGGGPEFESKLWKKMFPDLKTLKAEIWDQAGIKYIFNHMTDLTHLTLRFPEGRIEHLESVLDGTVKENSFDTLFFKSLNPTLSPPPTSSLHSMTKLKKLAIRFVSRHDDKISDEFVENTLLKIQPLQALTIGANVSRESAAKLRGYHRIFELAQNVDYDDDDEQPDNGEESHDDGEENDDDDYA